MDSTKKIDGKTFRKATQFRLKKDADKSARIYRAKGYAVRLIPYKNVYRKKMYGIYIN